MANSGMSIKDIRTVEDVQDIRNKIIFRMTEVLNTENLSEDKVLILEKSAINVSESKFVFINTPYNFLYRHNFK